MTENKPDKKSKPDDVVRSINVSNFFSEGITWYEDLTPRAPDDRTAGTRLWRAENKSDATVEPDDSVTSVDLSEVFGGLVAWGEDLAREIPDALRIIDRTAALTDLSGWFSVDHREPEPVCLRLFVPGTPRPKGSMKVVSKRGAKPVMQEDNPRSAHWRAVMQDVIGTATNWGRAEGWPVIGPVEVSATFLFEHPGDERPAAFPPYDLDKLLRNLLDALQGAGAIRNDAQVVRIGPGTLKGWADAHSVGAHIVMRRVTV